jgi:hypothetical protein
MNDFQICGHNWRIYKKSKEWQSLRIQTLDRAQNQCEFKYDGIRCKIHGSNNLEMHHVRYPHMNMNGYFPDDCLENVRMLCRNHHGGQHPENHYKSWVVQRPKTCNAKNFKRGIEL